MAKLQLHEIVGYLPYGLKCKSYNGMSESIDLLIGVYSDFNVTLCARVNNHNTVDYGCDIDKVKPILRPLSDVTNAIWSLYNNLYGLSKSEILETPINNLPHGLIKSWYESKFDIHNLIGRGLAIDINSIESDASNG